MEYTKETFPYNNWHLYFEECDRELVDNWRINIIKFSNEPCLGNYINWKGGRWGELGRSLVVGVVVSISQFKEFVLNIKDENIIINYDYLIPILKKINNK